MSIAIFLSITCWASFRVFSCWCDRNLAPSQAFLARGKAPPPKGTWKNMRVWFLFEESDPLNDSPFGVISKPQTEGGTLNRRAMRRLKLSPADGPDGIENRKATSSQKKSDSMFQATPVRQTQTLAKISCIPTKYMRGTVHLPVRGLLQGDHQPGESKLEGHGPAALGGQGTTEMPRMYTVKEGDRITQKGMLVRTPLRGKLA